jgi:hypothetical protein
MHPKDFQASVQWLTWTPFLRLLIRGFLCLNGLTCGFLYWHGLIYVTYEIHEMHGIHEMHVMHGMHEMRHEILQVKEVQSVPKM